MNGAMAMKEKKGSGKMRSMTIDMLDDGTFMTSSHHEDGNSKRRSYQSVKDLMGGMMEMMGKRGMKAKDKMMGEE